MKSDIPESLQALRDELSQQEEGQTPESNKVSIEAAIQSILDAGYEIKKSPLTAESQTLIEAKLSEIVAEETATYSQLVETWGRVKTVVASEKQLISLASFALDIGEIPLVIEVTQYGKGHYPKSVKLTQLLALAHLEEQHIREAKSVLEEYSVNHNDILTTEETRELYSASGRLYKEIWSMTQDSRDLDYAIEMYMKAHQDEDLDAYPIINIATLILVGKKDQAAASNYAEQVLSLTSSKTGKWELASKAEALLILGRKDEARDVYQEAMEQDFSWREKARIRQQARWICQLAYDESSLLDTAFTSIPAIVIVGSQQRSKFEISDSNSPLMKKLEEEIKRKLAVLNPAILFGSGYPGLDLLSFEAVGEGVEKHMILPCPVREFEEQSVAEEWKERFRRQLSRLSDTPRSLNKYSPANSTTVNAYTNDMVIGMAKLRANRLGLDLKALAVVDEAEIESSVLSGVLKHYDALNIEYEVIPSPQSIKPHTTDSEVKHEQNQKISSIFFADVVGFGRLTESQVLTFQEKMMHKVFEVIDSQNFTPLTSNTWGDALYLVFELVSQCAEFSLTLQKELASVDWTQYGLPESLAFRMALHSGPVFPLYNPITKKPCFTGTHITKAARIEPVVNPGQVFVSEEFAALLALNDQDNNFKTVYLGRRVLPKEKIILPLYLLDFSYKGKEF